MATSNFYPATATFAPRIGDGSLKSAVPAFNISANTEKIKRTWKGYIYLSQGTHTLNMGVDDNGSVHLARYPEKRVDILPYGPQGGGSFRYGTPQTITIEDDGYYKIIINYENIAYVPSSLSSARLEVLVDNSPIVLGDVLPCIPTSLEWPTSDIILGAPVYWYQVANNNEGVPRVVDSGVIDRVTVEEFRKIACIMFGEQSSFNLQEHIAMASTLHNRWGRGKDGELNNRSVLKTVSADLVVGTWASIGAPQYNKAMNETVANEEFTSLCCIIQVLRDVLENGPVYDYDFMVSKGSDSTKTYYRIGEHDFARVLKDCGKPDWYEEE